VRSLLGDGRPEPYAVLSIGGPIGRGGVRVRAGQEDVLLEPGVYAYAFEYETDRWVGFGEVEDQLFWNVTGNGFPINSASARVRIGELGVAPRLEAWTGPEGSTVWRRIGIDPPGDATPLRTDPPSGFSPAALGYLSERGYEVSQLAAAVVSMAMKGALRIERPTLRGAWRSRSARWLPRLPHRHRSAR